MSIPYNIYSNGDHAISVSFGNEISIATHKKVIALFHQLKSAEINGVKDIIPAYTTFTIVYDIQIIKKQTQLSVYAYMHEKLECLLKATEVQPALYPCVEIPVCYDAVFGIDLPAMSAQKKMPVEEIIQIHASTQYLVYMLGFLPGFAYMGTVDDRIATARLSTPRTHVAAGSVGIAGNQTGIYPLDSPGGWNIIGRTPLLLFNTTKEQPCLLQPGNRIKFVPINKEEFEYIKLQHEHPHH
ncbi:5-oxoprolinase subunit PxpB [soil metagenome]